MPEAKSTEQAVKDDELLKDNFPQLYHALEAMEAHAEEIAEAVAREGKSGIERVLKKLNFELNGALLRDIHAVSPEIAKRLAQRNSGSA